MYKMKNLSVDLVIKNLGINLPQLSQSLKLPLHNLYYLTSGYYVYDESLVKSSCANVKYLLLQTQSTSIFKVLSATFLYCNLL